jgi:hypothetical protein
LGCGKVREAVFSNRQPGICKYIIFVYPVANPSSINNTRLSATTGTQLFCGHIHYLTGNGGNGCSCGNGDRSGSGNKSSCGTRASVHSAIGCYNMICKAINFYYLSSFSELLKFNTLQIASLIPGGVKLSYSKFLASFDLVGALGGTIELLM